MNKMIVGTVGLFLLGASPVFANNSADSGSQFEVKTYNEIPYVSAGFGLDERAQLRELSKSDNLELSFALKNKDYLSGADIVIKDDQGKEILKAVSDGPLFFAKLPGGKYRIEATAEGRTEEQVVQVPAKGQTQAYFAWQESTHPSASQKLAKNT
jgi:hypothetical protein